MNAGSWPDRYGDQPGGIKGLGLLGEKKSDRSEGVTQDGMAFPTRGVEKKVDTGHGWQKSGTA